MKAKFASSSGAHAMNREVAALRLSRSDGVHQVESKGRKGCAQKGPSHFANVDVFFNKPIVIPNRDFRGGFLVFFVIFVLVWGDVCFIVVFLSFLCLWIGLLGVFSGLFVCLARVGFCLCVGLVLYFFGGLLVGGGWSSVVCWEEVVFLGVFVFFLVLVGGVFWMFCGRVGLGGRFIFCWLLVVLLLSEGLKSKQRKLQ